MNCFGCEYRTPNGECYIGTIENCQHPGWTTYWWEVTGEDSAICGEEFFTELRGGDMIDHLNYAKEIFPNEELHCWGRVTEEEAECMGLDTY